MTTKTLEGLPTLDADKTVKIWKMNYGFKELVKKDVVNIEVDGRGKRKATVDPVAMRMNYVVYGIEEAECLGIKPFSSKFQAPSDHEIAARKQAVFGMDSDLAEAIYEEVTKLNGSIDTKDEPDTETLKKE